MIDVMFVVISGQTDPNLIPIYSLNWSPKRIVMIYTDDDMKGNAENFKASIESNSNKFVFESSIVIKDPYDINEIKEKTEEEKALEEACDEFFAIIKIKTRVNIKKKIMLEAQRKHGVSEARINLFTFFINKIL